MFKCGLQSRAANDRINTVSHAVPLFSLSTSTPYVLCSFLCRLDVLGALTHTFFCAVRHYLLHGSRTVGNWTTDNQTAAN